MNEILRIKIEEGEFWFSGFIDDTNKMPYSQKSSAYYDALNNKASYNEVNPMLISSLGRYVYSEEYFVMDVKSGYINIDCPGEIDFGQKDTFKEAYNYLKNKYFAFDGRHPSEVLFVKPQYCSWMALGYEQTQDRILAFAQSILDAGMPAGELIIDDGWMEHYGANDFSMAKFYNPKEMCDKLKAMGFSVSVWVCPYVTPDSITFRELEKKGYIVKKNGETFICHWWSGYSACLDFTNPSACEWFAGTIKKLKDEYGVTGVKMDGGDPRIYENNLQAYCGANVSANELSEAYGRFAVNYEISELRSISKCAGLPVMNRIADRYHTWKDDNNGFDGIVKKALVMSFTGYPYNCPDMVGGGQIADVEEKTGEDAELNIRYAEAATFMPSIQFSKTLWDSDETVKKVIINVLRTREKYASYLMDCVKHCANTGEPIMRSMLYSYNILPDNTEQYMFGDDILVSPVIKKGQREKSVYLPKGTWVYEPTGETFEGERYVTVPAPLEVLPYFVRK